MNLDRIGTSRGAGYENQKMPRRAEERGGDFYKDLSANLSAKRETSEKVGKLPVFYQKKYDWMEAEMAARRLDCGGNAAPVKSELRNLSYAQCDAINVNILDGCIYKAQLDAEKHIVYVEVKMDDGEVCGYEMELSKMNREPRGEIEHIAWEARKNYEEKTNSEGRSGLWQNSSVDSDTL